MHTQNAPVTGPTSRAATSTGVVGEPVEKETRTRVFTGLKPTGQLQIGNYLGAIRPLLDLAADPTHEVTVAVVDLHALTVDHDPARLREHTMEMAATLLACGLDPSAHLFVQSTVPEHTELHYLIESTATYGEMHRMVQFKDKSDSQTSVRLSLLTYPSLMAADILTHQADLVPVGADQKQHLELARTLAGRFNTKYGPVFTVPEGVTVSGAARVKDLRDPDTKMGKSGAASEGVIHLLDTPDAVAAKVRRATTDSDPVLAYDPLGRPGVTNLAVMLGALTATNPRTVLDGIHGSGNLKTAVTDALIETLTPIREAYLDIRADETELRRRLRAGAEQVRPIANTTVSAARDAMGLINL